MGQDVTQGQVRLRLRFREGRDLPAGEDLWAEPVNTYDGGGVYRLVSTSTVVPLGFDDIVCAAVDGVGRLQVVDVVETSDRVLTVTGHDHTVTAEEARTGHGELGERRRGIDADRGRDGLHRLARGHDPRQDRRRPPAHHR